jgi:hypothetical protein
MAALDLSGGASDGLDDSAKRRSTMSFPRVGRRNSQEVAELLKKKQAQIEVCMYASID